MPPDADQGETGTPSPDEAFSALGNETRIRILQTLGEADGPLSFTELRTRVGIRHGGQFSYHLDRLVDHFVRETDDGYQLRQTGRRVIEAVLSGAMTADPVLEPTRIDEPCPNCGARTLVTFEQDRVKAYCPECAGHYGGADPAKEDDKSREDGYLGSLSLPPAGVRNRSAEEINRASWTWGLLELLAVASGVCPRCSAPLDESTAVCESHRTTDGLCDQCRNRHAVQLHAHCPNCLYEQRGAFVLGLLSNVDLLAFLSGHGINPVSPESGSAYDAAVMGYDEEVISVDPLEVRFTFTVDGDTLSLTVDDSSTVTDVTRFTASESA